MIPGIDCVGVTPVGKAGQVTLAQAVSGVVATIVGALSPNAKRLTTVGGSQGAAGVLAANAKHLTSVAGSQGSAGLLVRNVGKLTAGSQASAGGLSKRGSKFPIGAITPGPGGSFLRVGKFLSTGAGASGDILRDATYSFSGYTNGGFSTWAHTVAAGSNLGLLITCTIQTDVLTGVTFNGIAAALIAKYVHADGYTQYLYFLANPPVGTYDVVTSYTTEFLVVGGVSVSYAGVKQSTPTNYATNTATVLGGANYAANLTTAAAKSWLLMNFSDDHAYTLNAGSATTKLVQTISPGMGIFDGGPYATPGVQALNANSGGDNTYWSLIVELEPAASTGGLGPTGTLAKLPLKSQLLTGSLTPGAGALVRQVRKLLTGSLTLGPGGLLRQVSKLLLGTVASAGTAISVYSKTLAGAITPGPGTFVKRANKLATAAITPGPGVLVRVAAKPLIASITPAGVAISTKVKLQTATGIITPGPRALVRRGLKSLAGSVTPTGVVLTAGKLLRSLTGAITPGPGTVIRRAGKNAAGTISSSGIVAIFRVRYQVIAGTITPAAVLVLKVNKLLVGSLTPGGDLGIVSAGKELLNATIGATGALTKKVNKLLSGNLTPTGTTVKLQTRGVTGAITPGPGLMTRRVGLVKVGGVSPAGSLVIRGLKALTGAITSTGIVLRPRILYQAPSGAISSAASLGRKTGKLLVGAVIPSGIVIKQLRKSLAATIQPTGLSEIGFRHLFVDLTANVGPTGIATRLFKRSLQGAIFPGGTITDVLKHMATLYFAATILPAVEFEKELRRAVDVLITLDPAITADLELRRG